jgi:hypothetical protein
LQIERPRIYSAWHAWSPWTTHVTILRYARRERKIICKQKFTQLHVTQDFFD